MEDSKNICLACNLCCDGTLIGFVELAPEEISKVAPLLEVENAHGNGFFLQPCSQFCDGCGIYEQRPKACKSFKCGLLKSVEKGEVQFDTAVIAVSEIRMKKEVLEKEIENLGYVFNSASFYFKMLELNKWLKNKKHPISLSPNHKTLQKSLTELDSLYLKNLGVSLLN